MAAKAPDSRAAGQKQETGQKEPKERSANNENERDEKPTVSLERPAERSLRHHRAPHQKQKRGARARATRRTLQWTITDRPVSRPGHWPPDLSPQDRLLHRIVAAPCRCCASRRVRSPAACSDRHAADAADAIHLTRQRTKERPDRPRDPRKGARPARWYRPSLREGRYDW